MKRFPLLISALILIFGFVLPGQSVTVSEQKEDSRNRNTLFDWLHLTGDRTERIVGSDIVFEDIRDFYYTYSTSTYPPEYQRYRFYQENGRKYFFHESRQDGDWPQTEEDVTVNGTLELSEETWAVFCDCLSGGAVKPPSDEILDGDAGPFMVLYLAHDEGENSEFSFASTEKMYRFEELCSTLAENHVLTRFYYIHGGYMSPQSFEIFMRKGEYFIRENEDEARSFDMAFAKEIEQIIVEYNMVSWNGFHKSRRHVLDGEGFSLEFRYADGTSVYASGENSFPDGYDDAIDKIRMVLEKEKMSHIAGKYRYEGMGFGGDFWITLNEDSTYTFSEGPLSSYAGEGEWSVYMDDVYMTEHGGLDLSFMFRFDDCALEYIELNSTGFPYVEVTDGERFVKSNTEE